MRVAFIARYLQPVNQTKVHALASQPGIELLHIAPRRWTDGLQTYVQQSRVQGPYRLLPLKTMGRKGDIHRFMYLPLTLGLRKFKPDIIHLEEEPDSLVALQVVIARRLVTAKSKLILFTWQNLERPRQPVVRMLMRYVLRHTDRMIAGNQEAAQVLRRQAYARPIDVLPQLGVDTERFRPQDGTPIRQRLGLSGFVAGYAGRFVPEKGLDTLIDAVAAIDGVSLLLVGTGPMLSKLQAKIHTHGIENRVCIVPPVSHEQLAAYLCAMDALVLPSRSTSAWKEQFGHVLIEAMACGVPVIGSDSGAIPEVIGDAGLIFVEGRTDQLVEQLVALRDAQDLQAKLARMGIRRVAERYTQERIAEATAAIYHMAML